MVPQIQVIYKPEQELAAQYVFYGDSIIVSLNDDGKLMEPGYVNRACGEFFGRIAKELFNATAKRFNLEASDREVFEMAGNQIADGVAALLARSEVVPPVTRAELPPPAPVAELPPSPPAVEGKRPNSTLRRVTPSMMGLGDDNPQ